MRWIICFIVVLICGQANAAPCDGVRQSMEYEINRYKKQGRFSDSFNSCYTFEGLKSCDWGSQVMQCEQSGQLRLFRRKDYLAGYEGRLSKEQLAFLEAGLTTSSPKAAVSRSQTAGATATGNASLEKIRSQYEQYCRSADLTAAAEAECRNMARKLGFEHSTLPRSQVAPKIKEAQVPRNGDQTSSATRPQNTPGRDTQSNERRERSNGAHHKDDGAGKGYAQQPVDPVTGNPCITAYGDSMPYGSSTTYLAVITNTCNEPIRVRALGKGWSSKTIGPNSKGSIHLDGPFRQAEASAVKR